MYFVIFVGFVVCIEELSFVGLLLFVVVVGVFEDIVVVVVVMVV